VHFGALPGKKFREQSLKSSIIIIIKSVNIIKLLKRNIPLDIVTIRVELPISPSASLIMDLS